jgi:hypothetical protein
MKQLSTVSFDTPAMYKEKTPNISPIVQHSLTENAGKMSLEQLNQASLPREQTITLERAKRAWQFVQLLKSHRKRERYLNTTRDQLLFRSKYEIPQGYTHEKIVNGLIDICRPCSPMVTAHFAMLMAHKPFFDQDEERVKIVFESLYEDLKDYPEVSVVLALDDLRLTEGRYFPTTNEIIEQTKLNAEIMLSALDFFQEND